MYREEALRRHADPSARENRPLVIHGAWFTLLWAVVALLASAGVGLVLVTVPRLTDTGHGHAQASCTHVTAEQAVRIAGDAAAEPCTTEGSR